MGIDDNVIIRLRNFCDCESAGGEGILGSLRSDEYDGGVPPVVELLDVDGRYDFEGVGRALDEASAARLEDDARSLGDGEELRDVRSSSFNRLVRNNCSNCNRRSFAHASSYSRGDAPAGRGVFESAMMNSG